jgi:hypothetical protein
LIQLGASSLPVLTHKFMQARSAAVQQHTLEVLGAIGQRLGPSNRSQLMMDLAILTQYAVEGSVGQQFMEVVAALRRADESPSSRDRSPRPASALGVPEALP